MTVVFHGSITKNTNGDKSFTPGVRGSSSKTPPGGFIQAQAFTEDPSALRTLSKKSPEDRICAQTFPAPPSTIRTLLDELGDYYGQEFISFINSSEACLILVNGKGTSLTGGLDTPISQGDKIEILPFVGAG